MVSDKRRVIAAVCVAALLLTAFAPATFGVVCAILVPLDPLFAMVFVAPAVSPEPKARQFPPFVDLTTSRAPPTA